MERDITEQLREWKNYKVQRTGMDGECSFVYDTGVSAGEEQDITGGG